MVRTDKPLDNPLNWSFRLGRLFGIDIRIHVAFVICAVLLVWMEMPERGEPWTRPFPRILTEALGTYALLFLIVLLHEFGHCFGARATGGDADEILLWPLGGLAYANPPHNATAHMITTVAGPAVNVFLCMLATCVLVAWTGSLGAVPWNPLHPMWPLDPTIHPTLAQAWVMRFFGLSYFLLLINLLPIFPFDGGRMVQAWLWPRKGYRLSMEIATSTGMIGAIVVGLFGLFTDQSWILLMIAVFGYLTCWQWRRMLKEEGALAGGELGYDFSRGYAAFDHEERRRKRPGYLQRRRARKAARRAERERQRREERERSLESILAKISRTGLDSLTTRERRILDAETQRRRANTDESADTRSV